MLINRVMFISVVFSTRFAWSDGATMEQVNQLTAQLIRGYNKNTLPIRDQESEFRIDAVIDLIVISDLDEVQERLSTVMVLHLIWRDESMVWNLANNNNITYVTMESTDMWKPHLAVTNAHASKKASADNDWHLIHYLHTGLAEWVTMKTLHTSCDIDTTYYPFDSQVCTVQLYVYGYHGKIQFSPLNFNESHLAVYQPHSTWAITDYSVLNPDGPNITIIYHLQRNPRYMIVNFLVPLLVLAFLNPLVFLLPADSGERLGFTMTIMLALSVCLTELGSYLPQNSDPIPRITYTIMLLYVLSAFSVILLFVSARVFNIPDTKPVPKAIRIFVLCSRKLVCQTSDDRHYLRNGRSNEEESLPLNERCQPPTRQVDGENKDVKAQSVKDTSGESKVRWQDFSRCFDIFLLVFMYVVKLSFVLMFMKQ